MTALDDVLFAKLQQHLMYFLLFFREFLGLVLFASGQICQHVNPILVLDGSDEFKHVRVERVLGLARYLRGQARRRVRLEHLLLLNEQVHGGDAYLTKVAVRHLVALQDLPTLSSLAILLLAVLPTFVPVPRRFVRVDDVLTMVLA